LMRRLGCSDLQLFREDKPGLHERRLHRSSAPRLCSVCIKRASRSEQILADFGCLGCAKPFPTNSSVLLVGTVTFPPIILPKDGLAPKVNRRGEGANSPRPKIGLFCDTLSFRMPHHQLITGLKRVEIN
jgi:hypothetical protein